MTGIAMSDELTAKAGQTLETRAAKSRHLYCRYLQREYADADRSALHAQYL
jgi:hypothetical protein